MGESPKIFDEKENLTKRTMNGLIWMSSGAGIIAFVQFILFIVLARLLTSEDFGIVAAALVFVSLATTLANSIVGPAIVQRLILKDEQIRTAYTVSIILNLFLAIVFYFFASSLASLYKMDSLEGILRVISIIFILQGVSTVAESLLQRKLNFQLLSKINIISYFAYGIVGIAFAVFGYGAWSLIFAAIAQEFFRCAFLLVKSPHSKRFYLSYQTAKDLFFLGGGFSLAEMYNQVALQGDNFIVGRFIGADGLGYYSRAYQLMVMPAALFGSVLNKVLFPALAKVQDDVVKLSKVYLSGVATISSIILPISIGVILLAEEIIFTLLGSEWMEIVLPFQILALGLLFRTSYKISDSLVRAKGLVYKRANIQLVYAFFVLLGAWAGHFAGIVGVSVGVLFAIVLNFLLMANLSLKITETSWKRFILVHVPSIRFSVLLGIFAYILKCLLGNLHINSFLILLIVISLSLICGCLLIVFFPKFFIGNEAQKYITMLLQYLPFDRSRKLSKRNNSKLKND